MRIQPTAAAAVVAAAIVLDTSCCCAFVHRPSTTSASTTATRTCLSAEPSRKSALDTSDERAGRGGYSVLRQPLQWDDEADPTFAPPRSLDANDDDVRRSNVQWFQDKQTKGKNSKINNGQKGSAADDYLGSKLSALHAPTKSSTHHRREESEQQYLDLNQRTLDTLDYPLVLGALSEECGTAPARNIIARELNEDEGGDSTVARKPRQKKKKGSKDYDDDPDSDVTTMPLTAQSVEGVHRRYNAVSEMERLLAAVVPYRAYNPVRDRKVNLSSPPMGGMSLDIAPIFDLVDSGQVLEGPEILEVATTLEVLQELSGWGQSLRNVDVSKEDGFNGEEDGVKGQPFVELPRLGDSIYVEEELLELLTNAFDEDGRLSGDTFPGIGRLRAKVRTLKRDIVSTLDTLLTTPSISSKLSLESGGPTYSEVNGRIVIPVAEKYKNSVGIMHDVSRSGKTVYCEPNEIVGVTNEMRSA